MNWYLIQTKPNAHLRASKHLMHQNFEVFLPMIIRTSKAPGKFVNKKTPLFPGYLFMGSISKEISWHSINATRGVSKAVPLDGKYHPVRSELIEGLKLRCDSSGIFRSDISITEGDQLKIEKGPFSEFICSVEEIADNQRIWILINLMQQKIRTLVSVADISKL